MAMAANETDVHADNLHLQINIDIFIAQIYVHMYVCMYCIHV